MYKFEINPSNNLIRYFYFVSRDCNCSVKYGMGGMFGNVLYTWDDKKPCIKSK